MQPLGRRCPHSALGGAASGRKDHIDFVDNTLGSGDQAPNPHDLLDSPLAACTALTLDLYIRRRQMPVNGLRVTVDHVEESDAQ